MRSLLREGSPVRLALASLADDLLYSVLCLLCSVPVVTAGAAVTALFDLIMRTETGRDYGAGVYFRRFAALFKKATISWSCLILLDALLFFCFRLNASAGGPFRGLLWGLLFFCAWLLFFLHLYLPPLISVERQGTLFSVWRSALFMGIALLPRSVLMLLVTAVPFLFWFLVPEVFWNISFFFVFFWPAVAARIFFRLVGKYFPEFDREPPVTEEDGAA